jgi:hypothetical protein
VQQALSSGLFEPKQTEAQTAALRRLETLLALVEGWVDAVVLAAADERLQSAQVLAEAMRRRRAAGGPAEQTFATLVGLELRPRRLRDAAALWGAMGQLHGTSARDALWNHPDLLPTSDDLDDPLGFASNYGGSSALEIPDDLSELTDAEPGGLAADQSGRLAERTDNPPKTSASTHDPDGSASTGNIAEPPADQSSAASAGDPAADRPTGDRPRNRPGDEDGPGVGTPEDSASSSDDSQSDNPGN